MENVKIEVESLQVSIQNAYKRQRYSKCIELIETAPECNQNTTQYKILKASCLKNITGKSGEALAILAEVISEYPKNASAHYGKGLVFVSQGNLSEAVKCFETAIELDPSERMSKAREMKSRAENMLKSRKAETVKNPAIVSQNEEKRESKEEKSSPVPLNANISPMPVKANSSLVTKSPSNYTCNFCGKRFEKQFSLNRHMVLHVSERPHKCKQCKLSFIQRSDLKRHCAMHSDAKDLQCHRFDQKLKTQNNLSSHQLTHSQLRPFKCSKCPKTFKRERILKFHEEHHQLKKLFNCLICSKGFFTQDALKTHLEVHMPKTSVTQLKQSIPLPASMVNLTPRNIPKQALPHLKQLNQISQIMNLLKVAPPPMTPSASKVDDGFDPTGESDKQFFQLLFGEFQKMNEEQKGEFQRQTLASIKNILVKS